MSRYHSPDRGVGLDPAVLAVGSAVVLGFAAARLQTGQLDAGIGLLVSAVLGALAARVAAGTITLRRKVGRLLIAGWILALSAATSPGQAFWSGLVAFCADLVGVMS
jgi:hypothetical protein